jgi:hypothetical protein
MFSWGNNFQQLVDIVGRFINILAYQRISPSSKLLMKKHGIKEHVFSGQKIINKEHVLKYLEKGHITTSAVVDTKPHEEAITPKAQSVGKVTIDFVNNKNYLPQTYFENQTNLDNLIKFIDNMNKDHKKNLNISDFIARV